MTNAWFLGAASSVPQTESEVRSTVEPIRNDDASVEMPHAPEFNEFDTDESGELVGLSPRVVIGPTDDTQKYAPWWARLADEPHNIIVDRQVASSGTAAAREMNGEQGHGTMQYTESLEPVIRDGARFGNDYFVANEMVAQEGAGSYMTPPDTDNWLVAVAADRADRQSRQAFMSTQYRAFLGG